MVTVADRLPFTVFSLPDSSPMLSCGGLPAAQASRRKLGCCLLYGLCACKRTIWDGFPARLLADGSDAWVASAPTSESLMQRASSKEMHSGPPGF